jgi:hypothetical protein
MSKQDKISYWFPSIRDLAIPVIQWRGTDKEKLDYEILKID